MSHFNYTRSGGAWHDGVDTIDEADLEDFEAKMYKSINGDEGGSWAPSSPIVIGGSGVQLGKLRLTTAASYVADITALKALTGMSDGHVVYVKRKGLYFYEDPDVTAEVQPRVIAPTTGTGRWFHMLYAMGNIANGVAMQDATAQVPAVNLHNGLIDAQLAPITNATFVGTGGIGTVTGSYSNIGLTSTAVTFSGECNNGDVLELDCRTWVATEATTTALVRLAVIDGGSTVGLAETELPIDANTISPFVATTRYVLANVGTGGTASVQFQAKRASGSGYVYLATSYVLRARLIRS